MAYLNPAAGQAREGAGSMTSTFHTASAALTAGQSGTMHSNTGATGPVVMTLPAATPGLEYVFTVGAAFAFQIAPTGTDNISLPVSGVPGASAKGITCSTIGATCQLTCDRAGHWACIGSAGTWTAVP